MRVAATGHQGRLVPDPGQQIRELRFPVAQVGAGERGADPLVEGDRSGVHQDQSSGGIGRGDGYGSDHWASTSMNRAADCGGRSAGRPSAGSEPGLIQTRISWAPPSAWAVRTAVRSCSASDTSYVAR